MVFSSALFIFAFLPPVLAAYVLAPRAARNALLVVASLFFYAWGERDYVAVLLVSIAGNYAAGRWIEAARTDGAARRRLAAAVAGNLLGLIAFKYVNFLVDNLNPLLALAGLRTITLGPVHLPIGVSFFTFQAISYAVDVYRRDVPAERSPGRYALYAALFPHLIAGPIVRYRDLAGQLGRRAVTADGFAEGVRRFVLGLGKKVLLADTLAALADEIFALPAADLGAGTAWLGLACYTLQIYFDFSGYSDMAIGLAKLFGFDFAENFRHPYAAASATDFWRRWHVSLSSWFRDYLYIPLGGNRGRPARVYANLLVVFLLCGLWHGAAWTFLAWGLWHGAFLVAERAGLGRALAAAGWPLRHAYTLLAVMGGWVLFRATSLAHAGGYFAALAGGTAGFGRAADLLTGDVALALAVGAVACVPAGGWLRERLLAPGPAAAWRAAGVVAAEFAGCVLVLGGSVVCLAAGTYQPFLYFRF
jgi:alginate O-acetyltransferase complex protein AlgI